VVRVSPDLAASFQPGDTLSVVDATGEILHVPAAERERAEAAVTRAYDAAKAMGGVAEERISAFYDEFAQRLADPDVWRSIVRVNDNDVQRARARGRSVTRLVADDRLRESVILGLQGFARAPSMRGKVIETVEHDGWAADLVGAELGVVAFVFEGRPNVVADATGVLRGGNTVVFRIGGDALETAKAMLELALTPALLAAGLPAGAVSLVDSVSHAAAWALFSDRRLALAVARGSGPAVATLGSLAQKAGIPVSLHGKGGAWMFAAESASDAAIEDAVYRSLDRKVCNTLNTLCLNRARLEQQLTAALRGLERAAQRRGHAFKLHVLEDSEDAIPNELYSSRVNVRRAGGDVLEPAAETLSESELGREWEWEDSPEVTILVRDRVEQGVELFNRYSPHFVASLLSEVPAEHESFWTQIDAPFVGDGFTRWVDGQFALRRPELGLSNWERGRLFGRGGVLSGDGVFTVRTRYRTTK
jgi:glutamate-5-semialdehyde dehydrogenase